MSGRNGNGNLKSQMQNLGLEDELSFGSDEDLLDDVGEIKIPSAGGNGISNGTYVPNEGELKSDDHAGFRRGMKKAGSGSGSGSYHQLSASAGIEKISKKLSLNNRHPSTLDTTKANGSKVSASKSLAESTVVIPDAMTKGKGREKDGKSDHKKGGGLMGAFKGLGRKKKDVDTGPMLAGVVEETTSHTGRQSISRLGSRTSLPRLQALNISPFDPSSPSTVPSLSQSTTKTSISVHSSRSQTSLVSVIESHMTDSTDFSMAGRRWGTGDHHDHHPLHHHPDIAQMGSGDDAVKKVERIPKPLAPSLGARVAAPPTKSGYRENGTSQDVADRAIQSSSHLDLKSDIPTQLPTSTPATNDQPPRPKLPMIPSVLLPHFPTVIQSLESIQILRAHVHRLTAVSSANLPHIAHSNSMWKTDWVPQQMVLTSFKIGQSSVIAHLHLFEGVDRSSPRADHSFAATSRSTELERRLISVECGVQGHVDGLGVRLRVGNDVEDWVLKFGDAEQTQEWIRQIREIISGLRSEQETLPKQDRTTIPQNAPSVPKDLHRKESIVTQIEATQNTPLLNNKTYGNTAHSSSTEQSIQIQPITLDVPAEIKLSITSETVIPDIFIPSQSLRSTSIVHLPDTRVPREEGDGKQQPVTILAPPNLASNASSPTFVNQASPSRSASISKRFINSTTSTPSTPSSYNPKPQGHIPDSPHTPSQGPISASSSSTFPSLSHNSKRVSSSSSSSHASSATATSLSSKLSGSRKIPPPKPLPSNLTLPPLPSAAAVIESPIPAVRESHSDIKAEFPSSRFVEGRSGGEEMVLEDQNWRDGSIESSKVATPIPNKSETDSTQDNISAAPTDPQSTQTRPTETSSSGVAFSLDHDGYSQVSEGKLLPPPQAEVCAARTEGRLWVKDSDLSSLRSEASKYSNGSASRRRARNIRPAVVDIMQEFNASEAAAYPDEDENPIREDRARRIRFAEG